MAVLDFSPLTSQPSFGERYAQGQQQALQNQLAKQQMQMQSENALGLREERSALADQRRAATEGAAQRQTFLTGLGKKMSEGGHKLDRPTLSSMLQFGLMNKEGSVVELATKGLQALDEEDVFKTESAKLGTGAATERYTPVQIQNMLLSSSASMRDRGKALAAMKEPTLYSMAPGSTLAGAGGQVYTAPAAPVKSIGSVSPGDFTPASLAKFNVSGNFGDLVPKPVDRAPRAEPAPVAVLDPITKKPILVSPERAVKEGLTPANMAEKVMTPLQKQAFKKDFANDTSKVQSATSTADELEKLTDELVGNPDKKIEPHPGLGGITGYLGILPSLPKGEAAKAEQKLETFKGKIKALGRAIASQEGKLGNMAVAEWQMVSDAVQNISPRAGNLDAQMRDVVRQARDLARNMKEKFDLTYEDTAPATAPKEVAFGSLK